MEKFLNFNFSLAAFFEKADAGSIMHLAAIVVVPTMVIASAIGLVYLAVRACNAVKRYRHKIYFKTKGHLPQTSFTS